MSLSEQPPIGTENFQYTISDIDATTPPDDGVPYENEFSSTTPISFSSDLGDCRVIRTDGSAYVKIDTPQFTIISRYFKCCSDYNRQESSVGVKNLSNLAINNLENPIVSQMHTYPTRKLERYTSNIHILIKIAPNSQIINNVLSVIFALYPDMPRYYLRPSGPQIHVSTIIKINNENELNIVFKGGVNNIVRLFMSEQMDNITEDLLNLFDNSYDNVTELENVKVNIPVKDFEKIIGYKRPIKEDVGSNCTICFDEIKITEKRMSVTKCCNNKFHTRCLKRWLTKECQLPTCPMCRADMYPQRSDK